MGKPAKLNEKVGGIYVPIYTKRCEVVVTNNMEVSERRRKNWYDIDPDGNNIAEVCYNGGRFGMIFMRDHLTHNSIAHELFHLTHRIMEYIGDRGFGPNSQEPYAYLNGYLSGELYKLLDEWKEKITHED